MSARDARPTDRLEAALAAAGDVAYAWDLDGDAVEWFGRLPGHDRDLAAEIATGRGFAARIHPDDRGRRRDALTCHFAGGADVDCAYRLRAGAGKFAWVHERGRAERDATGRPQRLLGIIRAGAAPALPDNRDEHPADFDELTGHFNKTRLREAVDQIIAAHQRSTGAAAFLSVGVDNMTVINDAVGAEAGDTVLIEIGRRLDACVRVSDQVGRLGGDCFGVVLAHCPVEHMAAAGEKIVAQVNATPIDTANGVVYATVSVGGAAFPDHALNSYDVMTRAGAVLAEAKRAGGNCYRPYRISPAQRECQRRGRAVAEEVRAALREDRAELSFQPIVSAATGAVDYYEALLSIRGRDGTPIGAGEFVPAIEQLGLIRLVDRYVLERTIAEAADHPGVTLGFNVSGLTAADRSWRRALLAHLRARPDLAGRLVIEITETAALYDIEESARFVAALRRAGCRVALDDFGAGHSSLRYLQSLSVDTVKVAGALVATIAASAESQVLLRHLLQLAQGFGFRTVAEGVETAEDAELLRREGIGYLQGYYFGRPSFERPWRKEAVIASLSALPA